MAAASSTIAAAVVVVLALALVPLLAAHRSTSAGAQGEFSASNPYHVLGVPTDADRQAIVKAYRALALRWHPDRNSGDKDAEATFAAIAHAHDVLVDPEKREVFDRLGAEGLERLRDGDPSVHKDWLPPDEVLRRIHNDGDEPWLQSMVTSSFAAAASGWAALLPVLRGLSKRLGLLSEFPSVRITATDASGATLTSGATTSDGATFRFDLSGKSFDFAEADVTHNCGPSAKFLGMKTTFYLQCAHTPGLALAVSVAANTFTVVGREGPNLPSDVFELTMQ